MKGNYKLFGWVLILSFSGVGMILSIAQAQQSAQGLSLDVPTSGVSASSQRIVDYWTDEMMQSAVPMPVPMVEMSGSVSETVTAVLSAGANPGFAPGWAPNSGLPQPGPNDIIQLTENNSGTAQSLRQPQHLPAPTNPKDGPYAPFQRWTQMGDYTVFPRSVHGKLFFSLNGRNFVCSATVINRNTLITAGHCNSDGEGTFATNRVFCPSYFRAGGAGGPHPSRGCWSVVNSVTAPPWHTGSDPDYDYACLITATTGTIVADEIGDVTGWAGRAWNYPPTQLIMAFGYPAAAPFSGYHIIHVASPESYTFNFTAGGQVSKLIGNDMTGGSSGGSWLLSWNHRFFEYPDTDGSNLTDPVDVRGPYVNGVNSHKRCLTTCQRPPTTTAGVFWQEMSSPPFLNSLNPNESEDVIAACFANGGAD